MYWLLRGRKDTYSRENLASKRSSIFHESGRKGGAAAGKKGAAGKERQAAGKKEKAAGKERQ